MSGYGAKLTVTAGALAPPLVAISRLSALCKGCRILVHCDASGGSCSLHHNRSFAICPAVSKPARPGVSHRRQKSSGGVSETAIIDPMVKPIRRPSGARAPGPFGRRRPSAASGLPIRKDLGTLYRVDAFRIGNPG